MDNLRKFIIKHDGAVHRALEIILGGISVGGPIAFFITCFYFPFQLAFLVVFFDVFWLYKSLSLGVMTIVSHLRIKASGSMNWMEEVKMFPDWKKVHHVVMIVTVNEPLHILERALDSLANQDLPLKQITAVVATEGRVDEKIRKEKTKIIRKKYGKKFGNLFITTHFLKTGEVIGKASNENFAARSVKKELVDRRKMNINYITVTSTDADHCFHPKHYSYLTYAFLDDPNRYLRFWQPAVVFYNNYWRLPAIARVSNTFSTIWQMAVLTRTDRLISCQNYSLSLKLLDQVNYWDPGIIPEDYHLYFRAFYKTKGRSSVAPLFLPLNADAAESTTFWKTIKNTYEQAKRWSWGISDDPNVIKNYFLSEDVPFWTKTIKLLRLMEDHLMMPLNWFLLTLGITIPSLLVPEFSRTTLGYTLPKISSSILSICLITLLIIIVVNTRQRPKRPAHVSKFRAFLIPLEFILMPVAGLVFGAIPTLDAHARLMLGKYLQYRVTEKI